jgi:hypothetical protein
MIFWSPLQTLTAILIGSFSLSSIVSKSLARRSFASKKTEKFVERHLVGVVSQVVLINEIYIWDTACRREDTIIHRHQIAGRTMHSLARNHPLCSVALIG